jgi:hypothetical protein
MSVVHVKKERAHVFELVEAVEGFQVNGAQPIDADFGDFLRQRRVRGGRDRRRHFDVDGVVRLLRPGNGALEHIQLVERHLEGRTRLKVGLGRAQACAGARTRYG